MMKKRHLMVLGMMVLLCMVTQMANIGAARPRLPVFHLCGWNSPPNQSGEVIRWLSEYLEADLAITVNAAESWESVLQLWMASGDWPEVISDRVNPATKERLAATGALLDLSKYFEDPENYPNLAKVPKSVLSLCKDNNGRVVFFPLGYDPAVGGKPSRPQDNIFLGGYYIRKDVLDALKMKVPTTLAEVTQFLRAVKQKKLKDPNGNPLIPLGFRPEPWFSWKNFGNWWGDNWQGITKEGAYIPWFHYSKGQYRAAKWVNMLWREGLIDPEWQTQQGDLALEKLRNGMYAMSTGIGMDYVDLNALYKQRAWKCEFVPMPIPTVPGVKAPAPIALYSPFALGALYVTKTCKSPHIVAKLADWLVSPEGARCGNLCAVPTMIELKNSGPYKGKYWYKDAYQELDYYKYTGDTLKNARIKHGGIVFVGEYLSALRDDPDKLGIPSELTAADKLRAEWTKVFTTCGKNVGGVIARFPPDYLGAGPGGDFGKYEAILRQPCLDLATRALVAPTADGFQKLWDEMWKKFLELGGKDYIEIGTRNYWKWVKEHPGLESQLPYMELYKPIPGLKIEK